MNLKDEFITWIYENSNPNLSTVGRDNLSKNIDESNNYFDKDIMDVDESNYEEIIEYLKKELYKTNKAFQEYNASVASGRPRAILGKENYLKFIEEKFGTKQDTKVNYWIFQGSPEIYNIQEALRAGHLKSWKVAAHKDRIAPGDKVIIWQTGKEAGCYALAEVISEVGPIEEDSAEKQYYKVPDTTDTNLGVKIKITNNLVDKPVLWEDIKELPEFESFKAGNQRTNFSASREEFETIEDIADSEIRSNKYWEVKKLFPPEKVEKFLNILREYFKKHNLNPNDERVTFTVRPWAKILAFIIGNRYVLAIEKKKGEVTYSFTYPEILSESHGHFNSHRGEIETYWNRVDNLEGLENKIKKGFTIELNRNYKSPYRKSSNQEFIADVMQKEKEGKVSKIHIEKNSLNTILYGPPGTGKTFRLQDKYFKRFTVSETSLTKSQYLDNIVSELTWWQVLSVVLLDLKNAKVNAINEHNILKAKTRLSNAKSVRPIIWSSLQSHTTLDCPNVGVIERSDPKIFYKDGKSNWSVNEEELEQYYPEAISILKEVNDFQPSPGKFIKNYEFVTFHQSFGYEDFIEGIKPNMDEQDQDVSYRIEDGVFKKLCLKADADRENDYAIFIDEISRGNVSAIFGELITLIEKDKRLGEANELRAKLPYSKKELGVPPNLYIFGTMNTADRSVEALDTALRRRFTFEEVMPLPHLLENISFSGFNLREVLETINKRIEALLDRDHTIGHSYFIRIDSGDTKLLREVFQNKIIPLLQEYFYHDYEKIALILGEGFIERKEEKVKFANFGQIEPPHLIPSYELKKEITDIESAVRKLLNLKDEEAE